jgi:hypothetical protein
MNKPRNTITVAVAALAAAARAEQCFTFTDAGDEAGLFPHAAGIRGTGCRAGDSGRRSAGPPDALERAAGVVY